MKRILTKRRKKAELNEEGARLAESDNGSGNSENEFIAWTESFQNSPTVENAGLVGPDKALILLHEYLHESLNFLGIEQTSLLMVNPTDKRKIVFCSKSDNSPLPKELIFYTAAYLRLTKPNNSLTNRAIELSGVYDPKFLERLATVMVCAKAVTKGLSTVQKNRTALLLSLGACHKTLDSGNRLIRSKESTKNLVTSVIRQKISLERYIDTCLA